MENKIPPLPSVLISFVPIVALVVMLSFSVCAFGIDTLGGASQLVLLVSAGIAAAIGMGVYRLKWEALERSVVSSIGEVMPSILILLLIGALSGAWMASGIVPGFHRSGGGGGAWHQAHVRQRGLTGLDGTMVGTISENSVYDGTLAGEGSLAKTGSGTLTLAGAVSVRELVASEGMVELADSVSVAAGSTVRFDGADMKIAAASTVVAGSLSLADGTSMEFCRVLSVRNWRVKSVSLNGRVLSDRRVRHADLVKGGELVFEMHGEGK